MGSGGGGGGGSGGGGGAGGGSAAGGGGPAGGGSQGGYGLASAGAPSADRWRPRASHPNAAQAGNIQYSDGTVSDWTSESGEPLATRIVAPNGEWASITRDGFFDASRNGAGLIKIISGKEAMPADRMFQTMYRPDLVRETLAGDPQGKVRTAAARADLGYVLASGAAPRVRIIDAEALVPSSDQAPVRIEVNGSDGGIGRVEWRVNGMTLGIDRPAASADPVTLERMLPLDEGDNQVEVVAYNGKDVVASNPARATIRWDGTGPRSAPRLFIFAVGINDYWDGALSLKYAIPDAKAIAAALRAAGSDLYQTIEIETAYDAEVSRDNLDKVFNKLSSTIRPTDVFVLVVVGHGVTNEGRYYYLPRDFQYRGEQSIRDEAIGQDQWQNWVARIAARKTVMIFDTCESGTMAGEVAMLRGVEHIVALERLTRATGRTVLSASSDRAPALEGYRGHGVFTYAFLEGISKADTNGDGLVDVTELAGYLSLRVPEISFGQFNRRQVPQMKIVGSTFPLVKPFNVLGDNVATEQPRISQRPTHVVIRPAALHVTPSVTTSRTLPVGMAVTRVLSDEGWVLVARDGQQLGYVAAEAIAPMH